MTKRKKKMSPEQMREFIHSLRGSINLNTGGKPFAEWMADLNHEEKELEERKFQRLNLLGQGSKLNRVKRTSLAK
jgi:hypothetical protein